MMTLPTLFIGRWQPVHRGHIALWKKGAFDLGVSAVIYIRDIEPNEQNPFTSLQTKALIKQALIDLGESGEIDYVLAAQSGHDIIIGPDLGAVRYGRGVGYLVEEIDLPDDIKRISATEIRKQIKAGDEGWREFVTPGVAVELEEMTW